MTRPLPSKIESFPTSQSCLVTLWLNWFTRSLGCLEPLVPLLKPNPPIVSPTIVGIPAVPPFTTPRLTRKRKAAEVEAIADNDQSSPEAATKAADTAHTANATAPAPDPKSRSKQSSSAPGLAQDTERGSSTSSASLNVKKSRIATPATTAGSMDSDDDFMSDVSSQDDFNTQASDDESLGEGTCLRVMPEEDL